MLQALRVEHSKKECSTMSNVAKSAGRMKPERRSLDLVTQLLVIFRSAVSTKRWAVWVDIRWQHSDE